MSSPSAEYTTVKLSTVHPSVGAGRVPTVVVDAVLSAQSLYV